MLRWVVVAARAVRPARSRDMVCFRSLVSSPRDPGSGDGIPGRGHPPLESSSQEPISPDGFPVVPHLTNQDLKGPASHGGEGRTTGDLDHSPSSKASLHDIEGGVTGDFDHSSSSKAPLHGSEGGPTGDFDPSSSSKAYEAASQAYDQGPGRRWKRAGQHDFSEEETLNGDRSRKMALLRENGTLYFRDKYAETSKAVRVLIRKKLQPTVETALEYINERSGWAEVERLKGAISTLERNLREAQAAHREVREQLKLLQDQHRRSQVEMDTLLVTKHMWSEQQLHQYKKLLEEERMNSAAMQALEAAYSNTELKVDSSLGDLMEGLRKRFHEEQLWTDRIRQLSTWSTIAILMANSLIFMFTYLLRWREVNNVRTSVAQIREDVQQQDLASKSMCAQVDEMNQHLLRMEELLDRSHQQLHRPPHPRQLRDHAPAAPSDARVASAEEHGHGHAAGAVLTPKQQRTAVAWFVGSAVLAAWVLGRQSISG